MRYLVDDHDLDEATALALYRTIIRWVAQRADHIEISIQRQVYDDPTAVADLLELGEITGGAASQAFGRSLQSTQRRGTSDSVRVSGAPNARFVSALTERAAPRRAVSGDLSPVEDIVLSRHGRVLYELYDYGRTQMLDLDDDELADLRQTLKRAALNPAAVVVAPPYVTDER